MSTVKWNEGAPKVTPLKKGQRVIYELINIKNNPLAPDRQEPEIPFIKGVPVKSQIIVSGDNGEQKTVDIAYVQSYKQGGEPVFGKIQFKKAQAGAIILSGDNPADLPKYEYMERTPHNESSPFKNPNVVPIFKRRNYQEELKADRVRRKDLRDALNMVESMTVVDLRKFAVALKTTGEDDDELRTKIEQWAEKNPDKFLAMTENRDLAIGVVIDTAKKKKLITVDMQGRKILSKSGEILTTWPPEANVDWTEKMISFVKSEAGQDFYKELKAEVEIINKK